MAKISEALKEKIATSETVQIFVWLKDSIKKEDVEAQVFEELKIGEKEQKLILGEIEDGTIDDALLDSYIERKNDVYSELYVKNNSELVNKYFEDEKMLFMSVLTPMAVFEVESSKVEKIAQYDDVVSLDLYGYNFSDELNSSLPNIGSNTVNNTYGYTGAGVKIGQVEGGVPDSSVNNVMVRNGSVTSHATLVAGIINSVAPDAQIYSAAVNEYYTLSGVSYSVTGLIAAVEWLITTHNVNIINVSGGMNNYTYDSYCFWAEHIAINHNVHFVNAAGNAGANKVSSPGMAYNVITVGNLDDKNSSNYSIHTIASDSSYSTLKNGTVPYKPDLCAPGTSITYNGITDSGTSFAAPHVTGAIALMCEQKNTLKTQQRAVKAILAATTNYDYHHYSPHNWSSSTTNNYSRFGAGILNSKNAYTTIRYSRYFNGAFTQAQINASTEQTYTINVTSGMTRIRVAMASLCTVTGYSHYPTNISLNITPPNHPCLNIEVFYDGISVGYSRSFNGNIEIVDFDPRNYGTGTYTIVVKPYILSTASNTTYYTVAWW